MFLFQEEADTKAISSGLTSNYLHIHIQCGKRVYANREAMSATHGDGTDTLPGHLSSPLVFSEVRVTKSLVFCVVVCKLLFVCWPVYCLSFFGL